MLAPLEHTIFHYPSSLRPEGQIMIKLTKPIQHSILFLLLMVMPILCGSINLLRGTGGLPDGMPYMFFHNSAGTNLEVDGSTPSCASSSSTVEHKAVERFDSFNTF